MANTNKKQKYLVLTELSYPPERIAPVGSVVDDIPLGSIRHELEANHIVEVTVDEKGNVLTADGQIVELVFHFFDKDGNEIPNDGIPPEDSGVLPISELPVHVGGDEPETAPVAQEEAV